MLKSVGLGFCNVIALYVKLLCKGTLLPKLRISELPLADVSLPHDPMMPGVKLGSHLLPNHLAFMKEVSDVLTQRKLGWMQAKGILCHLCGLSKSLPKVTSVFHGRPWFCNEASTAGPEMLQKS